MKSITSIAIVVKTLIISIIITVSLTAQVTTIKGKLLDVNGKPSKFALVGVMPQSPSQEKNFVKCDKSGNYSIKVTLPGVNLLLYSIPGHSSLTIPVNNNKDKKFTLDVTLAAYQYKDSFDDVGVMGNFNDFNIQSPEKMKKLENGTYILNVTTDKKDLWYQLCGIEKYGRSINPPGCKKYVPDYTGDYDAVVPVKDGKAEIIFDPSKLLKSDRDYKVTFTGSKYDEDYFNMYNLIDKLQRAMFSNMDDEYKKSYVLLEKNYSNFPEVENILKIFPKEIKIKIGTEIPDFEVTSIDSPFVKFSKQNMLGKIYLIDFWATWCGPCVGELETLHKAYEKYKDKGFEIISLSRDGNVEAILKFRKDKWPMPWKNGFLGDENGSKIAREFEVIGIPKPILVDASGKILALEMDLRGESLDKTLNKYFNK